MYTLKKEERMACEQDDLRPVPVTAFRLTDYSSALSFVHGILTSHLLLTFEFKPVKTSEDPFY